MHKFNVINDGISKFSVNKYNSILQKLQSFEIKPIFIPVFLSAAILVSAIQFRNF